MITDQENHKVIIIGAGIIGLTLACVLAEKNLNVLLIESHNTELKWDKSKYDTRVSAINAASQMLLQQIGAWSYIESMRLCAYQQMYVWDSLSASDIHFNCTDIGTANLGHIIENTIIQIALQHCVAAHRNIAVIYSKPQDLISTQDKINLVLENGQTVQAKLLIGADGTHSWVRERAGISHRNLSYEQTAIVCTVRTERSHNKTAWQHFLPDSILAFLPLDDANLCSIVWSVNNDSFNSLISATDIEFNTMLTETFENKLGAAQIVDQRMSFPLTMRHAKSYVQPRIALVGDAVRTIHPLAGQGVNLGLLDVMKLAETIQIALDRKQDIGHILTLRNYERSRKADNLIMIAAMEGFKRLFNNPNPWLSKIRGLGLQSANKNLWLKNVFIKKAMGIEIKHTP